MNRRTTVAALLGCALLECIAPTSLAQSGGTYELGMEALDRWDLRAAIAQFERAGDSPSLRRLSQIYGEAEMYGLRDYAKAREYMVQAAVKGDPEALSAIGQAIVNGKWTPGGLDMREPVEEGLSALERACSLGEFWSCRSLATCLSGKSRSCPRVSSSDADRSASYAKRWKSLAIAAAQRGDNLALISLAYEQPEIGYMGSEPDGYSLVSRRRNLSGDAGAVRRDPARYLRAKEVAELFERSSSVKVSPAPANQVDLLVRASAPAYLYASRSEVRQILHEYALAVLPLNNKDQFVPDSALIRRVIAETTETFEPRLRRGFQALREAPVQDGLNPEQWLKGRFQEQFDEYEVAYWSGAAYAKVKGVLGQIESIVGASEFQARRFIFELKERSAGDPSKLTQALSQIEQAAPARFPKGTPELAMYDFRQKVIASDYFGMSLPPWNPFAARIETPVVSVLRLEDAPQILTSMLILGQPEKIFPALTRQNVLTLRDYRNGVLQMERARIVKELEEKLYPAYGREVSSVLEEFHLALSKRVLVPRS
jgi:TPR repeat protein